MELTNRQEQGLKIALEKYRNHEKYVVISGYAGTGKSTLVKFIIDAMDVPLESVAFATFTGKAAQVLKQKGNKNAMTLHRLLYQNIPLPNGKFWRKPKDSLEYDIIVVDEVSMVPIDMIQLLMRHKIFLIFLGDPFQLPQINKDKSHNLLDHPDIFLDEVMRQAAESEIIRLTMDIREGKEIPYFKGKEVIVAPRKELVTGHLTWADVVLTGTNNMRHALNSQIRQLNGYSGDLQIGEKLIIKSNYWDECGSEGNPLVNGSIVTVNNFFESEIILPNQIREMRSIPIYNCELQTEDGEIFTNFEMDKTFLTQEKSCLDWKLRYKLGKMKNKFGDLVPKVATYGNALTVHSAQGSEWDNVLVMEERFPFDKTEHARWLYTAVSRSSKKCVLIR